MGLLGMGRLWGFLVVGVVGVIGMTGVTGVVLVVAGVVVATVGER